jgi:hypothetical protein
LKVYGLGALEAFGFLYDINYLNVGIYQPRIGNIAQFEIHVQDLERWGEEVLKPGAAMAYAGEGKLVAGSHCKFCKAAAKCRALADYNNASIHDDFAPPQELDDEEILSIVEKADEIRQWLKVMEEWVLSSALQGKQWEGFKLVAGRSNRKFSDEIEVVNRLKQAGYTEEDIYNKAVKGISILEKEMGKKRVAEILDGLIVKPKGSPTLAPVSDPRQEWNSAEADFSQQ